jgi:hypothetical protein
MVRQAPERRIAAAGLAASGDAERKARADRRGRIE